MSTQPDTAALDAGNASRAARPATRARVTIVAAALALGSTASAATLLWSPGPDRTDQTYESTAAVRDAMWAGAVIDTVSFVVAAFALAIAVCLLAPARGAVWANVGAVLTAVGATLFGSGVIAHSVLAWYATASDAIPAGAGAALMEYVIQHPAHIVGFQAPGLLLSSVGMLLLAIALWRARSVPRWVPVAWVALIVGQFAVPPNRALDVEQATLMTLFVVIAWYLVRVGRRRTTTSAS